MRLSQRIAHVPPYLFVEITRKIAAKRAQGQRIISLAIGDPDLPTPPHVIERLIAAARNPANHRYPETDGLPELRQAVVDWYRGRFGVELDRDAEVLPLIGSKEGIGHMALCFIDPGDVALVTDPGYPVYGVSTMFAGGEVHALPLREEEGFLPDLESVPAEILARTKVLWLNYPNNPTAAVAPLEFFQRAVDFAKAHDIAICHDGPYSEVAFDGYRPHSFLEAMGARDVGIEFHSLSKSYNMTGWRIGMAVGNAELIRALVTIKSNLDSGIPQAVQEMAIEALRGPQDVIAEHNDVYQRRRDRICPVLSEMGLTLRPPLASLYVWARLPTDYRGTSGEFAAQLLDEAGVVVTPGRGYGPAGEGFIRVSLTTPDAEIDEAMHRLSEWIGQRTW